MYRTILGIAAVVALSGSASAFEEITFENLNVGAVPNGLAVYDFGNYRVEFFSPVLVVRQFGSPFPNTKVLSTSNGDAGPIEVRFIGTTVNWAEMENIINGRYTGEIDNPIARAFDVNNNQIDIQQNANDFLRVTGPGIARATFIEGSDGEGFVMDNFRFEVPSPGSVALLALGGLAATRRRR